MITTAIYLLRANVSNSDFCFEYADCGDVWTALEQFWHDDYPEVLPEHDGSPFPIAVTVLDGNGEACRRHTLTFNSAAFHAFYDHGRKASGPYTLDEFAKDIEHKTETTVPEASASVQSTAVSPQSPTDLRTLMDRWAGFCYNHPPYEDVILWMVGGSKQHYLYQHFCAKFSHLCDVCHDDTMGAWIKFYRELDSEWAERLMQYVYYEWKKDK